MLSTLLRKLLERGIQKEFNSLSELQDYQLRMINRKIKKAKKTPYWSDAESVNSINEFIHNYPITTREIMQEHGTSMVSKPLEQLIETHTSGTSGSDQVNIYVTLLDSARIACASLLNYERMGIGQYDNIVMLLPRTSSLFQGDGRIQKIIPNTKFIDSSSLTPQDIRTILSADLIQTYSNIPIQAFTKFKEQVTQLRDNDEINLKLIIGGGDFISEGNINSLKELLGEQVRIVNPFVCVEGLASTYVCPKGTIHCNSSYYLMEQSNENELLITPLTNQGMHYFRYGTGDIIDSVNCDCGSLDFAFKYKCRKHTNELHKHLRIQSIQDIIINSEPFNNNKINIEQAVIKTYHTSEGRKIEVYLTIGPEFNEGEEETIIKELNESVLASNDYAFKLLTTGEIRNWDLSFKLVNELPYKVAPGKWKVVID